MVDSIVEVQSAIGSDLARNLRSDRDSMAGKPDIGVQLLIF